LFLDEIGELAPEAQAKLLRALESREFTKLGDSRPTRVNVRVVAATNRNLKQEADAGHFRLDLYYRLSVVVLAIPPLRARQGDVPVLAHYFAQYFGNQLRQPALRIGPDALHALEAYAWPGNVRELRNVLERASILTPPARALAVADLPLEIQLAALDTQLGPPPTTGPSPALDLDPSAADPRLLRNAEKLHIQRMLQECGGNKAATARVLGIAHTTLYRKIEEYGL
jgi:DNA-binding NtrC family response regulator